ncbi:MAG: pyridoxal-phosphate dependent enzyme [Candidatus Paracaedibacteraceae bacterium]|nr:pyridoxal-phosphate dependent enzyme [Candidatus Paracaedibacteraceae bacterium]
MLPFFTQISFGKQLNYLQESLGILAPYPLHSRIHLLRTFGDSQTRCYVKREDELGFGVSGSKIRKYSSLIPYLQTNAVEEAVLIGGAYSNNIVGLAQLLIENSIKPTLFLKGDIDTQKTGNLLLTSMLVPKDSIHWVSREEWQNVNEKAKDYAKKSQKICIIPEGASMLEALPGALTLALDIIKNEQQTGLTFDHLFIDSGTGMMACATLLAFTWLRKKTLIHVVLMAEEERDFLETLSTFKTRFSALLAVCPTESDIKANLKFYHPKQARSFGSTNKSIFKEINLIAQTEGFLTDPVYSAKLFLTTRNIIANDKIKGNCLIIHSGGGLTLMGFQEQLIASNLHQSRIRT